MKNDGRKCKENENRVASNVESNTQTEAKDWLTPTWDQQDNEEVTAVKSEDNITVPVPKGFVASGIPGERKVSEGFVIKQGDNALARQGINEFVWVPITKDKPMFAIKEENNQKIIVGQLYENIIDPLEASKSINWVPANYAKLEKPKLGYGEPIVLTNEFGGDATIKEGMGIDLLKKTVRIAGNSDEEILNNWKKQLENDFEQMKKSVEKYGGFYIGRYETGNLSQPEMKVEKNNEDISRN